MSLIRTLAQNVKKKEAESTLYNSHLNYIFYGEFGKSVAAASLSLFTDEPVLLISPAGGSQYLESDFPNMISYPVANLQELEAILLDLEKNMEAIRQLRIAIMANDTSRVAGAKAYYEKIGEDWNYIYGLASTGKFPISAVVMEELSTASNWIQNKVETDLEIVAAGNDPRSLGKDWNILKRTLMDFYTKFLRLPVTTIFCTGSKLPSESQALTMIAPNIASGAAERQLKDQIGNVFYFYKDDSGRFKVKLTGDKKIYAKDKILSPYTTQTMPIELDVTGNPQLLWQTLNDLRSKDITDRSEGKLATNVESNAKKITKK